MLQALLEAHIGKFLSLWKEIGNKANQSGHDVDQWRVICAMGRNTAGARAGLCL